MKYTIIGIAIIAATIAIILLLLSNDKHNNNNNITEITTDTIIISKPQEKIHIKTIGKIKYNDNYNTNTNTNTNDNDNNKINNKTNISNTNNVIPNNYYQNNNSTSTNNPQSINNSPLFNNNAFTAILDTIYKQDTISIKYEYPKNLFTFDLLPAKDSIIYKEIKIKKEKEKWWVKPVIITISIVTGIIIGKNI